MFTNDVVRQITTVANKHGVEPAALEAIADVESAGVAFWPLGGKRLPPIRPEGHYFYRILGPGAKRTMAVHMGLAAPHAGQVRVPASRAAVYDMYERMKQIDADAAMESCSWGLGQVMGENWKELGYTSVSELVASCMTIEGQVELMERFIERHGLADELKRHDWAGFARVYNGAGYRKNSYDSKLRQAYQRYSRMAPITDPVERAKTPDPAVKETQKKLNTVGIPTPTNGKLDESTKESIKTFQESNGLVADGHPGTFTRDELDETVAAKNSAKGDKYIGTGLATGGIDATVDKLNESTQSLQWIGSDSQWITYLLLGLTIITVVLILYGLYHKFKDV